MAKKALGIYLEPHVINRFKAYKIVKQFESDAELFEHMLEKEIATLDGVDKAAFEALLKAWEKEST